ncbi:hypothetical protein P692DRAFT_20877601 [Suillus brevipes Sb2]|nr:hypothetical protein P692DRAFT_20877601 [Suillus brevipes Sb2]
MTSPTSTASPPTSSGTEAHIVLALSSPGIQKHKPVPVPILWPHSQSVCDLLLWPSHGAYPQPQLSHSAFPPPLQPPQQLSHSTFSPKPQSSNSTQPSYLMPSPNAAAGGETPSSFSAEGVLHLLLVLG